MYEGLRLQVGRVRFGLVLQLFSNTESTSSLPEQPNIKRGDSFLIIYEEIINSTLTRVEFYSKSKNSTNSYEKSGEI